MEYNVTSHLMRNVSDEAGIVNILIDNIRPVTWNKTAFDRLVLPPQTKELVKALVTVRTSQRGAKQGLGLAGTREDIIAGKGNGLIMLLHGGPGTGKSLTAGMCPRPPNIQQPSEIEYALNIATERYPCRSLPIGPLGKLMF